MVLQRLLQDHRLRPLINKRDNWDCTPLHYAVLRNNVNIAEILIKEGADTTLTDSMGRTPSEYISFIEEKPDPKLRDILETP
ncbi:hypothetical protein BDZ91DRAFT_151415 [Kalaharituber pfeilii]|nr:hypothetical protein BDZ91DRAFT_151415 [Kalaharituber pfeilii]